MTVSVSEKYILLVVELADVVERRNASHPNLFVGVRSIPKSSDLLKFFRRRSKRYGPFAVRMFQNEETLPRFETRDAANIRRDEVAQSLANSGFTVNPVLANPRHVYVLELDGRELNLASEKVLYVGETYLQTKDRIANHLRGYKDSPKVRKAFLRHRPDLEPRVILHSAWDSKAEEKAWAEKLRAEGFVVISA